MSERRKRAVRRAQQRRPLLDNGLLETFTQQRICLCKPERFSEIATRFRSNE
jgi:hypothetical protein